jgi:hypothetical protein
LRVKWHKLTLIPKVREFEEYNFDHDEVANSKAALAAWELERRPAPAGGISPGP